MVNEDIAQRCTACPSVEDILKLFYCGHAKRAFELLRHYGLLEILFPHTDTILATHPQKEHYLSLLMKSCENTDLRLQQNLSLNPAFLFAVLLWPALQITLEQYTAEGKKPYVAFEKAVNDTISQQLKTVAVPKRHTAVIREIWSLQRVMEKRIHRRMNWALSHPRFRAAYDFLILRLQSGETVLANIVENSLSCKRVNLRQSLNLGEREKTAAEEEKLGHQIKGQFPSPLVGEGGAKRRMRSRVWQ